VLIVRPASLHDAADVAGVHVRSWKSAYRGLLPAQYLDELRPEDRMARYTLGATDPGLPSTMVAVADGVICGFATIGPRRDSEETDGGEVLALYVDPDAWGRGIGRRLIAEARANLSQRGFAQAVLWVLAGNNRAHRFYQADGWLPDDRRRTEEIWGVLVHESRYRRLLP
jgi:GNAT superfamily N-acetyltransferase